VQRTRNDLYKNSKHPRTKLQPKAANDANQDNKKMTKDAHYERSSQYSSEDSPEEEMDKDQSISSSSFWSSYKIQISLQKIMYIVAVIFV